MQSPRGCGIGCCKDREVVGKARRIAEGGTKAIARVDDGSIGPKEGDEGCVDVAEGGWIGSGRWPM